MSDATPETAATGSIYKTLTWILIAALIGLYALYNWYDGTLKRGLVDKDAEMAELGQRLATAEGAVEDAARTENELRSQIAGLHSEVESAAESASEALTAARGELAALHARQESTAQQLASRQSEIERLTQELADAASTQQSLKAELEEAGRVTEAQRGELEGAEQRIGALTAEIASAKSALSDLEAKHAAEVQTVQSQLQERIDFLQTALEGSDPERATLIADLEERAETEHAALEQAEQAFKAREEALNARLAEALSTAEDRGQALESAKQSHTAEIRESQGLPSAREQELGRVQGELADLQSKLEQTVADLEAKLAQGEAALETAKGQLAAATAAASAERGRLEKQVQEAEARVVALEDQVKEAKARVATLEKSLETERAQARESLAEARRDAEAASAQALTELRGLYDRYAGLAARKTDRGMLLKLAEEDLRFASGYAVLPGGEMPSLDRIASLLKDYPGLTALIEGHTDNAGPDEINLELSKARADAVMQALTERGVAAERLTAEGAGEARPIAPNTTPAGRAQNRRVEVYVQGQAR